MHPEDKVTHSSDTCRVVWPVTVLILQVPRPRIGLSSSPPSKCHFPSHAGLSPNGLRKPTPDWSCTLSHADISPKGSNPRLPPHPPRLVLHPRSDTPITCRRFTQGLINPYPRLVLDPRSDTPVTYRLFTQRAQNLSPQTG